MSETSSASTANGSSTASGQTCDSPDIIGCETSSDSSATNVEADSVGIFDFVIVGGGTAGLAVAYRLSENTYTSVAVIEAGDLVFDNKNVSDVSGYGLSFGTEIDWQYESTAQTHAGGEAQTLRAGKALGGTSTINGNFERGLNCVTWLTARRHGIPARPGCSNQRVGATWKHGLELGDANALLPTQRALPNSHEQTDLCWCSLR